MLGLELTLFKYVRFDAYMGMTKSNLETCSKLGTSRVCNLRKSKFRETNPHTVPIDLNHGRIALLSNATESNLTAKSICKGVTQTMSVDLNSILKLPNNCVILTKALEINRLAPVMSFNESTSLGTVDNIEIHKINLNQQHLRAKLLNLSFNRTNAREFDINNKETIKDLESIRLNQNGNSDTLIIAGSSSFTVLTISITLMVVVIFCSKKCQKNRNNNNPVVVVVDDKAKKRDNVHKRIENLDASNDESDIDEPKDELENADSLKNQKSAESRKPPFRK